LRDLTIPRKFRLLFKKPFGKVIKGRGLKLAEEVKEMIKDEKVIAVGEIATRSVLKAGLHLDLAIVNFKTMKKLNKDATWSGRKTIKAKNPAGVITKDLWDKIGSAIDKKGMAIVVEGEEDPAVLPCILEADWDSVILYGRPSEGIVFIKVTEEEKERASMILKFIGAMQKSTFS
jgi:hypothetical protein